MVVTRCVCGGDLAPDERANVGKWWICKACDSVLAQFSNEKVYIIPSPALREKLRKNAR